MSTSILRLGGALLLVAVHAFADTKALIRHERGAGKPVVAIAPSSGEPRRPLEPDALPDQEACSLSNPSDRVCRGWTPVGPVLGGDTQVSAIPKERVQLFTWRKGTTFCQYLYRVSENPPPENTANGLLCYDTEFCTVRAWDAKNRNAQEEGARPKTWADMGNNRNINCSACHVAGPLLPMKALWNTASPELEELNRTCASRGGTRWMDAPRTWARPSEERRVPAPVGSTCAKCHTEGFVKGMTANDDPNSFCGSIVAPAFTPPNGAMSSPRFAFRNRAECVGFARQMGCTLQQFRCPPPKRRTQ